jgi:hypothetical protein
MLSLLTDTDDSGVDGFASHHLPLQKAPRAYEMFQRKHDCAVNVLLQP